MSTNEQAPASPNDIDALAQEIRRVDGAHKLGAGALADVLMPFILARFGALPAAPAGVGGYPAMPEFPEGDRWTSALAMEYGRRCIDADRAQRQPVAPVAAESKWQREYAKGAILGAAYDFRDAHLSGSTNLKRSAHAALESAIEVALAAATTDGAAEVANPYTGSMGEAWRKGFTGIGRPLAAPGSDYMRAFEEGKAAAPAAATTTSEAAATEAQVGRDSRAVGARPWKDAQEVYDRMTVLNPRWNAHGASREGAVATALTVVARMLDDAPSQAHGKSEAVAYPATPAPRAWVMEWTNHSHSFTDDRSDYVSWFADRAQRPAAPADGAALAGPTDEALHDAILQVEAPYAGGFKEGEPSAHEYVRAGWRAALASAQGDAAQQPEGLREALDRLERLADRKGQLWERCQGKGWPDSESDEFTQLRDELIPAARVACAALAATPVRGAEPAPAHPDARDAALSMASNALWSLLGEPDRTLEQRPERRKKVRDAISAIDAAIAASGTSQEGGAA